MLPYQTARSGECTYLKTEPVPYTRTAAGKALPHLAPQYSTCYFQQSKDIRKSVLLHMENIYPALQGRRCGEHVSIDPRAESRDPHQGRPIQARRYGGSVSISLTGLHSEDMPPCGCVRRLSLHPAMHRGWVLRVPSQL